MTLILLPLEGGSVVSGRGSTKFIPSDETQVQAFAYLKGRMFDRWIDYTAGSARSNGYNTGDLIDNPAYSIESLLRDEIFVERDLTVTTKTSTTIFTCTGLKSSVDDYYNGAIFYNVTTGSKRYVLDYTGSTKTITLDSADGSIAVSDNFYLTNVQGDAKIDETSFDKVGNTTNGLRDGWAFRFSLLDKRPAKDILAQMLFESHCMLFDTYSGFKLVALDGDDTTSVGWTAPMTMNSAREMVYPKLSPIAEIYTDFRLKYGFDYGKGSYTKEYFVNKSGYTSGASLSAEQTLCSNAVTNYKLVKKKFEYNCDYIYDDATALFLLRKLVLYKTSQRLIVNWTGEISTYIQYEKGDQVILDYSSIIPAGLTHSRAFMITSKTINPKKGGDITFTLMDMQVNGNIPLSDTIPTDDLGVIPTDDLGTVPTN